MFYVCVDCQEEREKSCFGKDKYQKHGLKTRCKQCEATKRSQMSDETRQTNRERSKEWYRNNKKRASITSRQYKQSERGKRLNRDSANKRREEFSKKIHDYYGGECFICHRNEPFYEIYDGHHVDPDIKVYSLYQLYGRQWDKVVVPELEKCVYLCANCHRKIHAGWFNEDIESGKLILRAGKKE